MSEPILSVRGLCVDYPGRGRFTAGRPVRAVDDISFDLEAGASLGIVGESGSGKSSLARALMRLVPAVRGEVLWCGRDWLALHGWELRAARRNMQMVFQDPLASLSPRMRIGEILAEPLEIFEPASSRAHKAAAVADMLQCVRLDPATASGYPHEFSGGQCQRIAIARAMMLRPKLLICDEPVSALDVSIQGQILNLLAELQVRFGIAMIFISHNLAVVRHLCHEVLVMHLGKSVEQGTAEAVFVTPEHPYTRALLAAVPRLEWDEDHAMAYGHPEELCGG
jgi:oligopeptide transport system ATP-binding protein